ncbi:MAG TPA: hypothetical protein DCS15_01985 [Flavobacteriales bacterium]|jgi:hypothetical protein|nr:DUF6029 family protein [Salibacteraceae bacterium]HAS35229.1 hypothetical protein [Flavobacteriales bacterium]
MRRIFGLVLAVFLGQYSVAQEAEKKESNGELHGNFDIQAQYYNIDSAIGAPPVDERVRMNAFGNLIYTKGKFTAGLRFESYQNAILGFNDLYRGNGIPYRFFSYKMDDLEITVGNFYEQFGNGQILRAYEERGLGVDNVFDGVRVKFTPYKGIQFKGLIAKQRWYFDQSPGIVRGFDADFQVNEFIEPLSTAKTKISLGGSAVSKYQTDENTRFTLPENVLALSGRGKLSYEGFSLAGEYTHKFNDPTLDNGFIYKDGQTLFLSGSYSTKGLGINVSAKHTDNMFFRSDRDNNSVFNDVMINYLPALTRQHTYNLAATLYPYATQPRGEVAFQADLIYKIKKKTALGGKYGTTIAVNYSVVHNIDTTWLNDDLGARQGYETNFFGFGDRKYFSDFNIEISRKFNKKFKAKLTYINFIYDMEIVQGLGGKPVVYADIVVADLLYKFNRKTALRVELQSLTTQQDQGNWATIVAEFTRSPHWVIGLINQYNYGNSDKDLRLQYPFATVTYVKNANRLTLAYGRQRAGIFCVGGVCRVVPASNGMSVGITSSF